MAYVAVNGGRSVEQLIDNSDRDGSLYVVKTQDCEGVMRAMKEVMDLAIYKKHDTQNSQRLVGSVPNVLALNWAQEWGVKLYSREWIEKAKHRLKFDPDWRYLRAGH